MIQNVYNWNSKRKCESRVKEIIAETFTKLMVDIKPQFQKAQRQARGKKKTHCLKRTSIRSTADF